MLDSLSIDHPVANALPPPKVLAWAAGPRWGGGGARWGVGVAHDLGKSPYSVTLDAYQGAKGGGALLTAGLNIRF